MDGSPRSTNTKGLWWTRAQSFCGTEHVEGQLFTVKDSLFFFLIPTFLWSKVDCMCNWLCVPHRWQQCGMDLPSLPSLCPCPLQYNGLVMPVYCYLPPFLYLSYLQLFLCFPSMGRGHLSTSLCTQWAFNTFGRCTKKGNEKHCDFSCLKNNSLKS